jgi:hypothetical protein
MNERIRELYETAMVSAGQDKQFATTNLDVATKFAELIVQECAACCGSQADMRNIRKRFGLTVESNIEYPGPETQGHHSQYNREYNFPK